MGSWSAFARQGVASTSRLGALPCIADATPPAKTAAARLGPSCRCLSSLAPPTRTAPTPSTTTSLRSKMKQKEKDDNVAYNRASLWDTSMPTIPASDHAVGFSSSFSDFDLTQTLHPRTVELLRRCLSDDAQIARQRRLAVEGCEKNGLLELSADQSYMIALLRILTHIKDADSRRIHTSQLWEAYWHLLRNPDALAMRIAHSEGTNAVAPTILPCDQSTIAYEIMAKYCIKYSRGTLLPMIAKTALSYLEYQRLFRPGQVRQRGRHLSRRTRGDIHSHYQDEFARLRGLFRTLRLAQNVRQAVFRDPRQVDAQPGEERWQRVPTDRKEVLPDDDNFSHLQMLKIRPGVLRLQRARSQLGLKQVGVRLSRRLSASRYPQYRIAPLARSINAAISRGDTRPLQAGHIAQGLLAKRRRKAGEVVAVRPTKGAVEAKGGEDAMQEDRDSADDKLRREAQLSLAALVANVERLIGVSDVTPRPQPQSDDGGLKSGTLRARDAASAVTPAPEDLALPEGLTIGLNKWKRLVRFDQEAKQQALSAVISSYRQRMDSDIEHLHKHDQLKAGESAIAGAIFPTWLLLAALRSGAGAGQPRKVAQTVRHYMDVIAPDKEEPIALRTKRLLDVLPINARIYAVSEAHSPPNSSSLLNAILRAHLHSTAGDRWERMLVDWELYCSGADGFAAAVNMAGGSTRQLPIRRKSGHLPCLHPDETSILLTLEVLHKRRRSGPVARAFVQECWKRWETLPSPTMAQHLSYEPPRYRSIVVSMRTFYVLLMQAKNARSADDFEQTLALLRCYLRVNVEVQGRRRAPGQQDATDTYKSRSLFGGNRDDEEAERTRWVRLFSTAQGKGILSPSSAEEHRMLVQHISWRSTPSSLPSEIAALLSLDKPRTRPSESALQ